MPKPPKTRAGGTWTEARYWQFVRSGLRLLSRRWPPRAEALKRARRAYVGPNPRQKWEYRCAACGRWWMGKEVQVDHLIPCGTIASYGDVGGFVERLLCEVDGFRVLCLTCHHDKTHNQTSANL